MHTESGDCSDRVQRKGAACRLTFGHTETRDLLDFLLRRTDFPLTLKPIMIYLTIPVSRKTPLDGRLEIPESVARRMTEVEGPVRVVVAGQEAVVSIEDMACTCAKAGGNHVHHFLAAGLLKSLPAGANARLAIDIDRGVVGMEIV